MHRQGTESHQLFSSFRRPTPEAKPGLQWRQQPCSMTRGPWDHHGPRPNFRLHLGSWSKPKALALDVPLSTTSICESQGRKKRSITTTSWSCTGHRSTKNVEHLLNRPSTWTPFLVILFLLPVALDPVSKQYGAGGLLYGRGVDIPRHRPRRRRKPSGFAWTVDGLAEHRPRRHPHGRCHCKTLLNAAAAATEVKN